MEGPGRKEVHLTPGTDMSLVPENRPGDLGERSAYLRPLPANQVISEHKGNGTFSPHRATIPIIPCEKRLIVTTQRIVAP